MNMYERIYEPRPPLILGLAVRFTLLTLWVVLLPAAIIAHALITATS